MKKIAIVTDSACALDAGEIKKFEESGRFAVVTLGVRINDTDITSTPDVEERIALAHIQGEVVQTSSPSPGDFQRVYQQFEAEGFDAIFSVHLSGQLSGTVNAAHAASHQLDLPIHVIDTKTVAMAQGTVVRELMRLTETYDNLAVLVDAAYEISERTRLIFYVPTLDALRKGGRIHPALARVGQMFQIMPVATVEDGRLVYLERPRTASRAKERLKEIITTECRERYQVAGSHDEMLLATQGRVVAVHYCGNRAEAVDFARDINGDQATVLTALPAVLSAHTGLGILAVAVY
ncbi:DegV family protein [Rothia terrae]|uniref:DegV family protein n=1 Tax=Rothia terrae TaxID=396015 RepID=UPI001444B260|nr:DegV family protein [Rothia terrae]